MGSNEMRKALWVPWFSLVAAGVALAASPAPASGPPAVVALTLDTSGSIGASDLERARNLATELLTRLPAGSEVAVLSFDDQSRVVLPHSSDSEAVRRAIASLQMSGRYTALHDALYDASRYLQETPPTRRAIVLITDGRDENSSLNLDDGLEVAVSHGIPVFAVGVGRVEERVLRRIAKLTSGEYVKASVASAAALAETIAALPLPAAPPAASPSAAARVVVPEPARPAASPARRVIALWLVLLGGLLAAAALVVIALKRGRPAPRCAAPGPVSLDGEPVDEEQLPTLIARMETTNEYLEKTITLSEKAMLVITSGERSGQYFFLSPETVTAIGRARANDIALDDVAVSSQHCRIRPEAGRFVLHDLKSTNGTYVNDQRVTRHILCGGDVLKVGETTLQFKLDQRRG